jgi:hypothetical protein
LLEPIEDSQQETRKENDLGGFGRVVEVDLAVAMRVLEREQGASE